MSADLCPVLVVDDDAEIRESLVEILEDEGFSAVGAPDGREAIEALRRMPLPGLILLDLMMPVMDGPAFRAEQVRHPEWAAVPVVIISAFRDVAATASHLGAAAFLSKPIDLARLDTLARRFCGEPRI